MSTIPLSMLNITQDQAIALLETPSEKLEDPAERYVAASQLVKYPGERTVQALMNAIQKPGSHWHDKITRRKAIETLGYLKAAEALPLIRQFLQDEDACTVENAIWSIGEIAIQDDRILREMTQLLHQPQQNYRLIIQTLSRLAYYPAVDVIRPFIDSEEPTVASSAISAVYQLTKDAHHLYQLIDMLQHNCVIARRSCIQDLIDASQYIAIPKITKCPVSMVFRLRGVRLLAEEGIPLTNLNFEDIEPYLDTIVQDHPKDLDLLHQYDQTPTLDFLLNELYETDFGRCYLATKTLLKIYRDQAPKALIQEYNQEAKSDYGAHYHIIKLLGWLKYKPAYDIFIEALHNTQPQYQKSRIAAAIALGCLGDQRAISELLTCATTQDWSLKYVCLSVLHQLGASIDQVIEPENEDAFVLGKYHQLCSSHS